MFLWKEELQPLCLLDVQEKKRVSLLGQKSLLLLMALNLSRVFLLELTLDQGCFGILLCNSTFQYLVEN